MRTYYRGHDALVTSELFVRRASPAQTFAIRDMRNVGITRDADGASLVAAAAATLLLLAAGAAAWSAGAWYVLIFIVVAAPAVVAGTLLWRRQAARWELRATYRGQPVALYSCADVRVFNQVSRALRRAIEDGRAPAVWAVDKAA
jgi:hypothetical protein